jgi:hypothetical protein
MRTSFLAGAAVVVLSSVGAQAAWDDWSVAPLTGSLGDLNYSVGGQLQGSIFTSNQPGTFSTTGGTGAGQLNARIERDYDSGLSIALKGQFEIFHDRLSSDNYGGNLVAKAYASIQTGLGRIDVGTSDGAAYALAIIGPSVNGEVSIDNPNATFFRDPTTGGRAFVNVFTLNSAVESSLNYDKISYYSPRLFGLQIAASFTPSEAKIVIPFANNGPDVPNRQRYMWEGALNYSDSFGPITLGVYGAITVGHNDTKTPGHAGLTDWAFGSEVDYNIDDDTKLALGGAYRQANTYAFHINEALAGGVTQSMHLSTVLTRGSWSIGGEFGNGTTDGLLGMPTLGMHGYLVDAAYAVNSNLQISGGWQRLNYHSTGTFYNGLPRIEMDGFFLHAALNI